MNEPLILGSASERRRKILYGMGVVFEVVVPQVNEVSHATHPRQTVAENALRKMEWCRRRRPGRAILTADTVLDFDGRAVGKPASAAAAFRCLKMLSGREHTVLTAVAYCDGARESHLAVVESVVRFKRPTDEEIREYLGKVEPLDRAGAYDIDQCPGLLIESYSGSRTNIMGLPVEVVTEWLKE